MNRYFLEHLRSKDRLRRFDLEGLRQSQTTVVCDWRRPSRLKRLTEICLCYVNAQESICSVQHRSMSLYHIIVADYIEAACLARLHHCMIVLTQMTDKRFLIHQMFQELTAACLSQWCLWFTVGCQWLVTFKRAILLCYTVIQLWCNQQCLPVRWLHACSISTL